MERIAIVIGSTGLVGTHLVELLCNHPHFTQVISLTRRPTEYHHPKLTKHIIDFNHLEKYEHLIEGDYLFSCLGSTLKQSGSLKEQHIIDVDYPFNVAELAANNHIPFHLLVSSSGANANSRNAYLKMKGTLEDRVKTLNFPKTAIFQPSLLLGRRAQKRIGEGIGAILLPLICKLPGLQKYRPIQGKQVAQKMLQVSLTQNSCQQTYQLDDVFPEQ